MKTKTTSMEYGNAFKAIRPSVMTADLKRQAHEVRTKRDALPRSERDRFRVTVTAVNAQGATSAMLCAPALPGKVRHRIAWNGGS